MHFSCHFLAIGDGPVNCRKDLRISPTETDQEIPRTLNYLGQGVNHEMPRNNKEQEDNRLNRRPVCTLTGAGANVVPIPDGRVGMLHSFLLIFLTWTPNLKKNRKNKQNKQNRAHNIENLKLAKIIVSLPNALLLCGWCLHAYTYVCTCTYAYIHKGQKSTPTIFINMHLIFWDRFSRWICTLMIG